MALTNAEPIELARVLGGLCRELREALAPRADADARAQAITWGLLTDGFEPSPEEGADVDSIVRRMRAAIGSRDFTAWADSDAWDVFYEAFVARYDSRAQRHFGVRVTPAPAVQAHVRLIHDVLARYFRRPLGFASQDVVVVDPAAGTGAYPLAVVNGRGGADWNGRLHLFEWHRAAAAVATVRLDAVIGREVAQVQTLDILERPLQVSGDLVVCLGNPPYERQVIARGDTRARKGGWVRFGDADSGRPPLLADVVGASRKNHAGLHLKSVFNDYVYFWRWAVWAVCEQRRGPGIVSFLTPASFLRGPGFVGLRELLRTAFDAVWILDLEGDHLAARQSSSVFAIRTPVTIAIAARFGEAASPTPARTRYARLEGSKAEKQDALGRINSLDDLTWLDAPDTVGAPFVPRRRSDCSTWPALTDLFPWQTSGCQMKRTWPIGPTPEVLRQRWARLLELTPQERSVAFRPTRDRSVVSSPAGLRPIAELECGASIDGPVLYAYRSFDRQWLLADPRLGDFMRPLLWRSVGPRQVFLTSLLTNVLGPGPAAVVSAHVPDLDHFRGSFGGRAVIPLWCDAEATRPNLASGLIERLAGQYQRGVEPEAVFAYCYALLGTPTYVARFAEDLREPGPRVPLTPDAAVFERGAALGRRLISLHTFGERILPGAIHPGAARCVVEPETSPITQIDFQADNERLSVGGGQFAPVSREVWTFSVSGMQVMKSWLGYRMRRARRRATSPLDLIVPGWSGTLTQELLELIWVLEATLALQPDLDALLDAVVTSGSL